MHKKIIFVAAGLAFLFLSCLASTSRAEELVSYDFFENRGMLELAQGRYADAIVFFNEALALNPQAKNSLRFLNAIRRLLEGRYGVIEFREKSQGLECEAAAVWTAASQGQTVDVALPESSSEDDFLSSVSFQADPVYVSEGRVADRPEDPAQSRKQDISAALDIIESAARQKVSAEKAATIDGKESNAQHKTLVATSSNPVAEDDTKKDLSQSKTDVSDTIYLNDELWSLPVKPRLEIEIDHAIILEGDNVERFLVVTPGFISIKKIDRNKILLMAEKRGSTIILVWDAHGRWSFNAEVIFPSQKASAKTAPVLQEESNPFRFTYAADWSQFYSSEDADIFERRSLIFTQRLMLDGETPYGDIDTSVIFNKFDATTKATGYTIGLSDGSIGPLSDFRLRGFDARKTFSPLTLSSKYFRGILFEKDFFDENMEATFLWGRDRSAYGYLLPGAVDKRDFFVTGGRVHLFPKGKHQYAFNYTASDGNDRPSYVKNTVMSVETFQDFGKMDFAAEIAYGDKDLARTANFGFELNPQMDFSINLRDIDKNYATATSSVGSQGEAGSILSFVWRPESFSFDSTVDIYRNRYIFNPQNEAAINYDWSTSIRKTLTNLSWWNTNIYYSDTPGLVSPHRDFRIFNTYSKNFKITDIKMLSLHFGQSYQKSRYAYSPASEFDRVGLSAGARVPLLRDFTYFCNYEYSWVQEVMTGKSIQPNVLTTGFDFSRNITQYISGNVNLSYRNEQNAQGTLSFLAGEDSAAATLGLFYRPSSDLDLYFEGTVREVWPDDQTRDNFLEGDFRMGVRVAWDMPFRWNPQGYAGGVVFKDLNGNGIQDPGEDGIPDIVIKAGKSRAVTGSQGSYLAKVSGKKVQVGIDFDSVPAGYVFTTSPSQHITIAPDKVVKINFGLTTRSEIYGVAFVDNNQNGKPDGREPTIADITLILDGKQRTTTDFEGSYSFSGITAGKHVLSIDVNSIPIEYLPAVKVQSEIEVQEGTTYIFHIPLRKNISVSNDKKIPQEKVE
ncbi:MAG TPA: SdrD B-like domain-containing protein [Candidatus Omnitrophota bacterium]|nr:SdrD B-like domain-containing protein [Candidatus Omnitrophota bacterium]